MKRFILGLLIAILVVGLILSGCAAPSKPSPSSSPAPAPSSPTPGKPATSPSPAPAAISKTIVIGTNAINTVSYTLGVSLGEVITKHSSIKVDQFPQPHMIWWPMINTGEVTLGFAAVEAIYGAYLGKYDLEKPTDGKGFDIRTVMHGYTQTYGFYVAGNSGIKTAADLKGKRVITDFGSQFTSTLATEALLANAGLTRNDVVPGIATDVTTAIRAIIEGRTDAAFTAIGSGVTKELDAAKGALVLPANNSPESIAAMKKVFAGYSVAKLQPASGLTGIKEEQWIMTKPMILATHAHESDDLIYALTKAMGENIQEIWPVHPTFKDWTKDKFVSMDAVAPYHPGAIRWYKEAGLWTPEIEKYNNELLALKKK